MHAVSSTGRIPAKHVRIEDVTETDTDEEILAAALTFTGETRSSIFGWRVERFGTVAAVALHTD